MHAVLECHDTILPVCTRILGNHQEIHIRVQSLQGFGSTPLWLSVRVREKGSRADFPQHGERQVNLFFSLKKEAGVERPRPYQHVYEDVKKGETKGAREGGIQRESLGGQCLYVLS